MTPTLVHRYAFPIPEAIEALLGDAVGDCEAWSIRIEGDEVVVDVVAPAPNLEPSIDDISSLPAQQPDLKPELKGGRLAQRAAIACGERGFWTFLDVGSADEARADICRRCGVNSRRLLDHDAGAAAIWNDIDGKYRLWLEGHDVEL